MTISTLKLAARTAVAVAAVAACSGAMAVTSFTFNPSKIPGVSSSIVTADTFTVNDYALVVLNGASFTETGFLAINSFNLNGQVAPSPGLNTSYGAYVSFNAAGTSGNLTSLSYNIYGYSGSAATFTASAAGVTKTPTTDTLLASGSLLPGNNTFGGGVGGAFLIANSLSFVNAPAGAFSNVGGAIASFVNSSNQITATATGFYVTAGGGTINLVPSAVPEPETYAMLLAGLAAVGFVSRRRSKV
jgi:PEP-CTERM motif